MPARRNATSAARAVPPAPITARVSRSRFRDERLKAVDVGVVGDDPPSDANERVDRSRFARVRRECRRRRDSAKSSASSLNGAVTRKAVRREALAARERRGDVEKVVRLENRIRRRDSALAEDGVVNGRRDAVRRRIADDGEDLLRPQRAAIRTVNRQRLRSTAVVPAPRSVSHRR